MLLALGLAADFPCSEQRFLREVPMGLQCCRQLNQHGAPRCIVQLEPNSLLQRSAFCELQACLQLSSFPLQQELQFASVAVQFCPIASRSAIARIAVEFCPYATRSAIAGIAVVFSGYSEFCCCFAALCPAHILLLPRHYCHVHPCGLSPSSSSSTLCSFIAHCKG